MFELGDPIGFWAASPCRWAPLVEAPPRFLAPVHAEAFRSNSSSQHDDEHPLLIGGKDQGLLAGQVMRLGADVPFSIEEQHPQQLACGIKQVHRDDANRAGAAERSGGHG